MARRGLRIDGDKELLKSMESLSEEVKSRAKHEAVMAAAELMKSEIERRAPVRTGKLRDNITIDKGKKNELVTEVAVGPSKDAFYGMMLEYGTRKMNARPFVRPAFDENRDKVNKIMESKIREAIDRAVVEIDTS